MVRLRHVGRSSVGRPWDCKNTLHNKSLFQIYEIPQRVFLRRRILRRLPYIKHRHWDSTVAEQSLLGHEFRGSSELRGPLHGSIPYLRRHSVGLFAPEWFRELGGLLHLLDMREQGTIKTSHSDQLGFKSRGPQTPLKQGYSLWKCQIFHICLLREKSKKHSTAMNTLSLF